MEPLRIAMFSDSALPILNGVSVSVDALVGELRNQGHSVHLYTARYPHYRDPDANTYRFRALETPISRGYPVAIPPFYRMLHKFRRQEYDVVHTHTPFVLGMVGLRWAESHGLPIVSTYHTLYDRYSHYFRLLPRRYIRFRIAKHTNFYYNHVDHVLTPSEASMKWLKRHSVSTPTTVVPTGIPRGPMLERAEMRQALGIPPDARILLYVGRLAQEKNLGVLLEAAAAVCREDPRARLWLVGDGPYRQECVDIVRRSGIGDRVRFVGFVPRAEVDRYYAAADLFVFSSITETQGLVVQEAMTHGLPAVVVAGGGAGASVVDGLNGFVVKNEAGELARTIQRVLRDEPLYSRLTEQAPRSVRDLGVPAMGERVLAVYRQVIRDQRESANADRFAWV
ncbi:glycosyltransferase [Fimbriimonas ginsengisoli]|uniref:Glycosyl transferase group 1 n=1 Tax=Fimbriimonas ginsengisoli Gsoil 348 TaxID=661478 RepID=A0A068NRP6_FIMGI|nr:glycosyltransferase [Fimbriimonas ginsengisoli]AIE86218.1 glycosyl transferase group 1 [Fimbriimonas ginsengisoli Gsoil 348]